MKSPFESVPINDRQRGDLIFFGNKAGVVHHVAIYLGDGTMMESYGDTAAIRKYSPQYGSSYVALHTCGGWGADTPSEAGLLR